MKSLTYLTLQALREGTAPAVHVREIIRNLELEGWNVKLFRPRYTGAEEPGLLRRAYAQFVLQLRALLSSRHSTVFYVRSHPNAFPSVLCAILFRKIVVLEVNGPHEDIFIHHPRLRFLGSLLRYFQLTQFRLASGIVCVTDQLRQWVLSQVERGNVIVAANAANETVFHPGAKSAYTLPAPYVVFSGTLRRWHGVDWLLDAVGRQDWPRELNLVIMGDGPEACKIQRALDSGSGNIIWLKKVPYEQVAGVLAGAAASLIAIIDVEGRSRTGLAPLKLYESMACGVPVIASRLPFQAEIVERHHTGLVVAPGDSGDLVAAVRMITADPAAAAEMGRRGREYIENGNTWRDRAAAISGFLASLPGAQ